MNAIRYTKKCRNEFEAKQLADAVRVLVPEVTASCFGCSVEFSKSASGLDAARSAAIAVVLFSLGCK